MIQPKRMEYYRLEELKAYFGDRHIADIRQKDIEEWKAKIIEGRLPSTVN